MTDVSRQSSSRTVDEDARPMEDGDDEQQEAAENGCRFDRGTPAQRYADIPGNERLVYPRGNKLDRIYASTRKPDGLVPVRFLPIWPELHTDRKLPILPAPKDLFEISRGQVGTGLYRPVEDFTVLDPLNQERVMSSRYNALHDPHAKALFDRTSMRNHILSHMLIYSDGLVRCNAKEFNDLRRYLNKRIYTADISRAYEKMIKIEENQRAQVNRIKKDISKEEGALFKMEETTKRAKEFSAGKMVELRQRIESVNAYNDFRSEAHKQMLSEHRENLILKAMAKEAQIKHRLATVKAAAEKHRKCLIAAMLTKDQQVKEFMKSEKERKAKEHEEYLIDWLSVRCETQNRQIVRAAETKKTVAATLKKRALKRQIKVDNARASLAQRMAERMAEEKRIWDLVRKYFYRWLDIVRLRKANKPDEFHRTFFSLPAELEVTLNFLRKESGYEKLDDFILNIVKLKRDIMAQIESEEQAEAAAALGLAQRERAAEETSQNEGGPPSTETATPTTAPSVVNEVTEKAEPPSDAE